MERSYFTVTLCVPLGLLNTVVAGSGVSSYFLQTILLTSTKDTLFSHVTKLPCVPKTSTFYFLNNSVKNNRF